MIPPARTWLVLGTLQKAYGLFLVSIHPTACCVSFPYPCSPTSFTIAALRAHFCFYRTIFCFSFHFTPPLPPLSTSFCLACINIHTATHPHRHYTTTDCPPLFPTLDPLLYFLSFFVSFFPVFHYTRNPVSRFDVLTVYILPVQLMGPRACACPCD